VRQPALLLAVVALGASSGAAEQLKPGPDSGAAVETSAVPGAAASDPVLSRLGLSAEQARRIAQLWAEQDARIEEGLRLKADEPGRAAKLRRLADDKRTRAREVLTEEQRQRFDAGAAAVAECQNRILEALRELTRSAFEARGDPEKLKAARAACAEKVRGLRAEQERLLDEKVGKPGAAAPLVPAAVPEAATP